MMMPPLQSIGFCKVNLRNLNGIEHSRNSEILDSKIFVSFTPYLVFAIVVGEEANDEINHDANLVKLLYSASEAKEAKVESVGYIIINILDLKV